MLITTCCFGRCCLYSWWQAPFPANCLPGPLTLLAHQNRKNKKKNWPACFQNSRSDPCIISGHFCSGIQSMCDLWTAALLTCFLPGLGASAKRKTLFPFGEPLGGGEGLLHAGAPPAAFVGALQTRQCQVSQIPLFTWAFSPETFLLCIFDVLFFGKVSLEWPHLNVRCQCYFSPDSIQHISEECV